MAGKKKTKGRREEERGRWRVVSGRTGGRTAPRGQFYLNRTRAGNVESLAGRVETQSNAALSWLVYFFELFRETKGCKTGSCVRFARAASMRVKII